MDDHEQNLSAPVPKPKKVPGGNPFASGFVPNGKRRKKDSYSYLTKKGLLKHMLEVPITIQDLPTKLADNLRKHFPGQFEHVNRRFTLRQIVELTQLQLLFSKSDYVRQDAIDAIKDRVDGKPKQTLAIEGAESEPAEIKLSNGRVIII
jgi:hypothetical protein